MAMDKHLEALIAMLIKARGTRDEHRVPARGHAIHRHLYRDSAARRSAHPGRQHGDRHVHRLSRHQDLQAVGQPDCHYPVPHRVRRRFPRRRRNVEPERGEECRRGDRGERRAGGLLHLHRRLPHGLLLRLHQAQAVSRRDHDELRGHHHVDLGGRHGAALLERLHEGAALHHQRARALGRPGRRLAVRHRGRGLPHRHRALLHPLRQRRRAGLGAANGANARAGT